MKGGAKKKDSAAPVSRWTKRSLSWTFSHHKLENTYTVHKHTKYVWAGKHMEMPAGDGLTARPGRYLAGYRKTGGAARQGEEGEVLNQIAKERQALKELHGFRWGPSADTERRRVWERLVKEREEETQSPAGKKEEEEEEEEEKQSPAGKKETLLPKEEEGGEGGE